MLRNFFHFDISLLRFKANFKQYNNSNKASLALSKSSTLACKWVLHHPNNAPSCSFILFSCRFFKSEFKFFKPDFSMICYLILFFNKFRRIIFFDTSGFTIYPIKYTIALFFKSNLFPIFIFEIWNVRFDSNQIPSNGVIRHTFRFISNLNSMIFFYQIIIGNAKMFSPKSQ